MKYVRTTYTFATFLRKLMLDLDGSPKGPPTFGKKNHTCERNTHFYPKLQGNWFMGLFIYKMINLHFSNRCGTSNSDLLHNNLPLKCESFSSRSFSICTPACTCTVVDTTHINEARRLITFVTRLLSQKRSPKEPPT